MEGARVTGAHELPASVVVCVQAADIDEPWCLVVSETKLATRNLLRYDCERCGIEAGPGDLRDMRFGMGLSSMRVAHPERRDPLLLVSAWR